MIKDLEKGQSIIGFFAVKEIAEKETREQKKYLDLTLVDVSGEMNAKVWDVPQALIGERPQKGNIIKTDATVEEYKGTLQLKIHKLRKGVAEDNYDLEAIIPSAPVSPDRMFAVLSRFIETITDEKLKTAVRTVIQKYKDRLLYYPAAKAYHHSYQGGLLHHITTMLLAAEKLTSVYSLDTDLLYTGIILHDIGKLRELDTDGTGIGTEYSLAGEMLGHIALGLLELEHLELDAEKKLLLQHMIVSHHQTPEWGSPKPPMVKEAELLHHLDMIDARMHDFDKAANQIGAGTLSQRVPAIDRKVYRLTDG